jgi:hypothetical protein
MSRAWLVVFVSFVPLRFTGLRTIEAAADSPRQIVAESQRRTDATSQRYEESRC